MILQPNHIAQTVLPAGSTLGKYEILRKLATGGMAEIYLARARGVAGFEKTVVLKRILPHVATDDAVVQMFLDEARLAATLQHPNIADVYDVGEVDGNPFFTMEYVHGQDVRAIRTATRKRNEPTPLAISLAIIHGTAAALDYAHERRSADGRPLELVHRDVSASNIIVSYDGAIKLLDFGIARAASHQHKTQVGTLKGKTPYMSPEQCRAQRIDRRSDLFSLGVVMFELTVGRRPFRGESDFAIMEQIVHGVAPPPGSIVNGYPDQLEAIVMRMLAHRADERYQTAEELIHDLEPFIAQHGLWVSSKQLGKYMRLLFADRIEAWERAAHRGVTLSEHVAETITSESERIELVTPPSAFPGLPRLSQEFPAVAIPTAQLAAVMPPLAELLPDEPPESDTSISEVPKLRSWRGGRALAVLAVLAVLAGAVAGGIYAWPRRSSGEPGAASPAASPAVAAEPPPAPAPPAPAPRPAVAPPAVAAEPPPAPATGEPATGEPETGDRTVQQPPAAARSPGAAKRVPPPRLPSKPPQPPKKPDQPPKDPAWDPNSPYLPN